MSDPDATPSQPGSTAVLARFFVDQALTNPSNRAMLQGVLRPSRRSPNARLYAAKARDYQRRWPWLTVLHTEVEQPENPIFIDQIGILRPTHGHI